MLGALDTQAMWFLTRGTGIVSMVLLTLVLALGILQVQRWETTTWPRFVVAALHKNASLLAVVFLAVHIASSVIDGFAPIKWLDAVIPFGSGYRPMWLGLGALSFDLLIALVITSLVRLRLGYTAWRVVHWTAYACWPLALVHGLGTGSDSTRGWVLLLYGACLALVLGATIWRISSARVDAGARTAGTAVTIFLTLIILGWVMAGPAKAGWSRRAGTPADLLGSTDQTGLALPLNASLSGTTTQSGGSGAGTAGVTIDASLDDAASSQLHISLQGTALAGGGIQMSSSQVTLGPTSDPQLYQGQITSLRGGELTANLHDSSGAAVQLDASLNIQDDSNRVTGSVEARTGTN